MPAEMIAPPPAPAPKPTAPPPKPAPAPAPKPPAGPQPLSPYDELDSLQREAEEKSKKPPEKPEAKPSKKEEPEKIEENAPPKPEEKKPEEPKKPERAAELRTAYENLKKKHSETEAELARLRKPKDPAEDPDKKALVEEIETLKKHRDTLENQLRVAHYEASDEYKKKYEEPIKRAFEAAYSEITQLKITDAEGNERDATPGDFNALVQMPLAQAIAAAKVFGDASVEVLAHRRRILQMNQDRTQAVSEAHAKQENAWKEQQAALSQQRQWWADENTEAETKYTRWSKPDDADPKEAEILAKATQIADAAFGDTSQMPPKDRVRLHAAVRNKARWFDLQVYRNRKLTEEIDSLKAKLAEFEASTPDKDTEKRGKDNGKPATWEDEIAALDR